MGSPSASKWNLESEWLVPPQQARSRKSMEAVLNAAEELFTSHGYDNTSIADIGARSGVSTGSIYSRFPDKDAILQVIHDSFSKALTDASADAFSPETWRTASAAHIVMAMVDRFFFAYRTYPGILCLIERQRLVNPAVEERARKWNNLSIAKFQALLADHASEMSCADTDRAVTVVHYLLHQTLAMTALFEQEQAAPPFRLDDNRFERDMMEVALRYFGLPDDTTGWRRHPWQRLPGW
ncbi:TetR/AcrR family transcriptional regulator [Iodidimonas sp. SYSU 1G8]|uniref:TetR/AcrR family transcriptional regulator n=1 Tax=Iodidimonas sp. SYSU 1G8 TaxID=3133967 RepID=UPI0031FF20CA